MASVLGSIQASYVASFALGSIQASFTLGSIQANLYPFRSLFLPHAQVISLLPKPLKLIRLLGVIAKKLVEIVLAILVVVIG